MHSIVLSCRIATETFIVGRTKLAMLEVIKLIQDEPENEELIQALEQLVSAHNHSKSQLKLLDSIDENKGKNWEYIKIEGE